MLVSWAKIRRRQISARAPRRSRGRFRLSCCCSLWALDDGRPSWFIMDLAVRLLCLQSCRRGVGDGWRGKQFFFSFALCVRITRKVENRHIKTDSFDSVAYVSRPCSLQVEGRSEGAKQWQSTSPRPSIYLSGIGYVYCVRCTAFGSVSYVAAYRFSCRVSFVVLVFRSVFQRSSTLIKIQ